MSDNQIEDTPVELALALVREAPDAIVVTDVVGIVRLWNRGAERIFGYPAAEAIGHSLDLIIPVKQRARHWSGYHATMTTGITRYGERMLTVPATHRDGHRLSVEFSIALLRGADGRVIGSSAIMREISERRLAERELRGRLAELEQQLTATTS